MWRVGRVWLVRLGWKFSTLPHPLAGRHVPTTAKEVGRDLVVRALAPLVVWWLAVVGMGWLLADGLPTDLGVSEGSVNKSLESPRTTIWDAVTLFFSWTGATVSIIGVCLVVVVLIWRRTKLWWFAVVPLMAISPQEWSSSPRSSSTAKTTDPHRDLQIAAQ